MAVLVDLVVARSDQGAAAVAAQVHRAVRVALPRVEVTVLLMRQVVAAEVECGTADSEVAAAVLLQQLVGSLPRPN